MSMPGMYELIIIFGVVVLLFGGKKLPELGGAIGESIRNFKKSVKEHQEKPDAPNNIAPAPSETKEESGEKVV